VCDRGWEVNIQIVRFAGVIKFQYCAGFAKQDQRSIADLFKENDQPSRTLEDALNDKENNAMAKTDDYYSKWVFKHEDDHLRDYLDAAMAVLKKEEEICRKYFMTRSLVQDVKTTVAKRLIREKITQLIRTKTIRKDGVEHDDGLVQLLNAHLTSRGGENLTYLKLLYDYMQLVRSDKSFYYDSSYTFDLQQFIVVITGFVTEEITNLNRNKTTDKPGAQTNELVEGLISISDKLLDINSRAWNDDLEITKKLKVLLESTFK
jgi:hypothetical protein